MPFVRPIVDVFRADFSEGTGNPRAFGMVTAPVYEVGLSTFRQIGGPVVIAPIPTVGGLVVNPDAWPWDERSTIVLVGTTLSQTLRGSDTTFPRAPIGGDRVYLELSGSYKLDNAIDITILNIADTIDPVAISGDTRTNTLDYAAAYQWPVENEGLQPTPGGSLLYFNKASSSSNPSFQVVSIMSALTQSGIRSTPYVATTRYHTIQEEVGVFVQGTPFGEMGVSSGIAITGYTTPSGPSWLLGVQDLRGASITVTHSGTIAEAGVNVPRWVVPYLIFFGLGAEPGALYDPGSGSVRNSIGVPLIDSGDLGLAHDDEVRAAVEWTDEELTVEIPDDPVWARTAIELACDFVSGQRYGGDAEITIDNIEIA